MRSKILSLFLEMVPILIMIALIRFVVNDFLLLAIYCLIILASGLIKYEKGEVFIFIFGVVIMGLFEWFFILTGVEVFLRRSFFIMPIWLPILWGYGFVAIKRCVGILEGMLR